MFDAFLKGNYSLCLSTEVLFEYEEKFNEFWGVKVTYNLLATILTAPNISLHSIFYNFRLVEWDEDDNMFSDLYLSASADILVTNDTKLLALRKKEYPAINVITIDEFMALL